MSVQEMAEENAYIWTREQIKALNHYLRLNHPLPSDQRHDLQSSMKLQRGVLPEQTEQATALWSQSIGEGYYLCRFMFDDGVLADWLLTYDKDMQLKLLCNVSNWYDPNKEVCNGSLF